MPVKDENNNFKNLCLFLVAICIVFCVFVFSVYFLLPSEEMVAEVDVVEVNATDDIESMVEAADVNDFKDVEPVFSNYFNEAMIINASDIYNNDVDGLSFYRDSLSRPIVEWFYTHITGNREVATAILAEADKNDIPLSLAFSLAYVESRYDARAVNVNSNSSIDRGLFQLNNRSFTSLSEEEFFNPAVSAKYGMSHLRFCLDTAGNEVSALAMYNAGTTSVRLNKTPQSTLNYIYYIMFYREKIDRLFSEQVCSYFEPRFVTGKTVVCW